MKLLKKFQTLVNSHFALLYNFDEIHVHKTFSFLNIQEGMEDRLLAWMILILDKQKLYQTSK